MLESYVAPKKIPYDPEQRKRLRLLRVKHDLTQSALAEILGQPTASVGLWETTRPIPSHVSERLSELYPEDWPKAP